MSKQNVKNFVLPHSEAKLEMYHGYLEKYLNILVAFQGFNQINLFDVFCGSGIYDDGKAGSPILAFKAIMQNREWCKTHGKSPTTINLSINDVEKVKVENIKAYLEFQPKPTNCNILYENLAAQEYLAKVQRQVELQSKTSRSLIFIDPYGYKDIKADLLDALLNNERTEVILFLPVSFIYRFAGVAQGDEKISQYEHLREFISSFFPHDHPIRRNEVRSPIEFIDNLKEALAFKEKYHSASYFIQRDKGNYFALFFMTSNLLGLEKFLKTKWELDPVKGLGYKMPNKRGPGLFDTQFEVEDRDERIQSFANELEKYMIEKVRSDKEIYEFTLYKGFLPEHLTSIFKQWQNQDKLETWISHNNTLARKGSFNINYNSTKPAGSKFVFKIK
ncbi:MAG: three-Cys-motif partner protein TcmP [Saprospiraceae bacterium]|nr:three-Cys-motif partner protein TcmP [Saprospiraceae bacterium]MCB0574557.1 three-Cys-motif partner protein TcmP [Saprospiraceae bacterium]MCB9354147.1 three-Cys-motif partner protein TcmP [Lewinellaceae bacterium]